MEVNVFLRDPCKAEVKFYLKLWNSMNSYRLLESSLRKLFRKTYKHNHDIDDVLIKVVSLNDFYSTNIFSPFTVAKHIVSLGIDDRLKNGDMSVVNEIANVKMKGGRIINFYSFATKYCSHHKPEIYPIYDYYVEKVLMYFKWKHNFFKFRQKDLKVYDEYRAILEGFRIYYNLESFSLKQIDQYLWQIGKKYFPKKYV